MSTTHPSHSNPALLICAPPAHCAVGKPARLTAEKINNRVVQNRILAVMLHTTRYAFKGKARLAADCGVAPSTITRLILGECSPSFALAAVVTTSLERQLKKALDPREIISLDGSYPTSSVCRLCGCRGCLPDEVYDENDQVKSEYRHLKPGQWTTLSAEFVEQALQEEQNEEAL